MGDDEERLITLIRREGPLTARALRKALAGGGLAFDEAMRRLADLRERRWVAFGPEGRFGLTAIARASLDGAPAPGSRDELELLVEALRAGPERAMELCGDLLADPVRLAHAVERAWVEVAGSGDALGLGLRLVPLARRTPLVRTMMSDPRPEQRVGLYTAWQPMRLDVPARGPRWLPDDAWHELLARGLRDVEPAVRGAAAAMAFDTGLGAQLGPELLACLHVPAPEVLLPAILALGAATDDASRAALHAFAHCTDPALAVAAIRALVVRPDAEAQRQAALGDHRDEVRSAASHALAAAGIEARAGALPTRWQAVREAAVAQLPDDLAALAYLAAHIQASPTDPAMPGALEAAAELLARVLVASGPDVARGRSALASAVVLRSPSAASSSTLAALGHWALAAALGDPGPAPPSWIESVVENGWGLGEAQSHRAALAAIALDRPALVPQSLGLPVGVRPESAPHPLDVPGLALRIAAACGDPGQAADALRACDAFVEAFPLALASGGARWIDLVWLELARARALEPALEGVAERLARRARDAG